MRLPKLTASTVLLMIGTSAAAQQSPQQVDFGKYEFESKCASCHGASGKGNGPLATELKKAPPDLTMLAKNNGGVLPLSRLYQVIDGADIAAHGSREMPVWGREYRAQAGQYVLDPTYSSETFVRARILALLDYLNRLQSK